MYIYIRTCIHIYIHTYIHTCIRTYIHTYVHIRTYTYIHYIRTYIQFITYVHTYVRSYIVFYDFKEKADAIASRSKESDHDASLDLAEKTKQVNSLQRKLIDMEKQNKTLQEKLENVCM